MPSLLTLAAMKAYTLGRRAKWKDYVDLYFLMHDICSLSEICRHARFLFSGAFNSRIFLEQLIYFDDVDASERVFYMPGYAVPDAHIRAFFTKTVMNADLPDPPR